MFELRDLSWAAVIAIFLFAVLQYRPMAAVRRKVERDANEAFTGAYAGRRYLDGNVIWPAGSTGGRTRDLEPAVLIQRFEILEDELSWDGDEAELVVRHVLREGDGTTSGRDLSRDVHVKLARKRGRWQYTHCEVRDHGIVPVRDDSTPWLTALMPSGNPS